VAGTSALKPARLVAPSEPVHVSNERPRFVSRGGEKLDAALERFRIDVAGKRCLDAGASTGGFTDCLLRRGAAEVFSVDVGYGQLDKRLRDDPRVRVLERTNIRDLSVPEELEAEFGLIVADLSFISLTLVAPVICRDLAADGAHVVALVKPQFEAGREAASRGKGVIRDDGTRRKALGDVAFAFEAVGATIMGAMASPLIGPAGNAEFLLHARAKTSRTRSLDALDALDASASDYGNLDASTAPVPHEKLDAMLDLAIAESPDA